MECVLAKNGNNSSLHRSLKQYMNAAQTDVRFSDNMAVKGWLRGNNEILNTYLDMPRDPNNEPLVFFYNENVTSGLGNITMKLDLIRDQIDQWKPVFLKSQSDINSIEGPDFIGNVSGGAIIPVFPDMRKPQVKLNISQTPVKEGVDFVFEQNPELANQVYEAAGIPKVRLYRVYNPSAKGVVIESQEKYTGQWFTTDLDYALSYVEKNKKVIKGQNVTDNKYDYSDLKVDVVELNPSEAKKYLLSQETILKEKLDVEPDNFIIPSTITRSATINIGKEIGISNKVIKSFLPSEKDVFKKNIPLPTTSKFENLLQLEQQAQQLYSQYLDTIFPDYIDNFAYEAVEELLVSNKIIDRKC